MDVATRTLYRTVLPLAVGGMGRVDLVVRHEPTFVRLFALKRLRPEYLDEPEVRDMFIDEARLAGLLRHPNAVGVYDVGEDSQGPFLLMDYVEGVSVAHIIAAAAGEPIPLEVCLGIGIDVANGLHAAHELVSASGEPLGLVHRDVSPQNILVGFDGIARVTDFGIARALGRASKTSVGILKGKLGYMAPEQLKFDDIDRRTDLFALGVVVFELLSGERLYAGKDQAQTARRILTESPPDLSEYRDDVDSRLVELLFELLAKSPDVRPSTASEVAARLEAVRASALTNAPAVDTAEYLSARFSIERDIQESRIRERLQQIDTESHGILRRRRGRRLLSPQLLWLVVGFSLALAAAGTIVVVFVLASERRQAPSAIGTEKPASAVPKPTTVIPETKLAMAEGGAPAVPTASSEEPARPLPRATGKPRKRGTANVPLWEEY